MRMPVTGKDCGWQDEAMSAGSRAMQGRLIVCRAMGPALAPDAEGNDSGSAGVALTAQADSFDAGHSFGIGQEVGQWAGHQIERGNW